MSRQGFRELLAPPLADLANATTGTTEVALVPVTAATGLAVSAGFPLPGQVWKVTVAGVTTTGATAANWTFQPRWGTSTAGVALGASQVMTKTVSLTGVPWMLQLWLQFRAVNSTAATQTTAVAHGTFESAALARDAVFGGTVATVDTNAAQGIWLGVVSSAADAATLTPRMVLLETFN